MISLELAQKLRDAGLEWEWKNGDLYYEDEWPRLFCVPWLTPAGALNAKWIFAPRLEQILAEIERRGYVGLVSSITKPKYTVYVVLARLYAHSEEKGKTFFADTPEEAAGLALLWILEQEGER